MTAVDSASEVSAALVPRSAELAADIYRLIVKEIPALHGDSRVLTLLEASVAENVSTTLHILQHGIDLEHVRALGPLAHDDENSARLRETLRVFLQENLSYKSTAERLVLHKNTVQYRVRKAEESLQHPVAQDRLLIELALLATQRLGVAVLRPGADVRA